MNQTLLLVGCGKMGGALLKGWLDGVLSPANVTVIEPFAAEAVRDTYKVAVVDDLGALGEDYSPDIVVFAVKPQGMADIVPSYARFVRPGTLFLSIAAGRPISFLAERLGGDAAIVRSMPNTPAAVGRGITVGCPNAHVTPEQKAVAQTLLESVGEVGWVADEALIDAVTAVSGSGPAYVFLLIECLGAAGVKAGLDPELAARLALATVAGSGELARLSDDSASQLRENVTSPGGTTAAALAVLMADDGLGALMTRAVMAAADRSRELAG